MLIFNPLLHFPSSGGREEPFFKREIWSTHPVTLPPWESTGALTIENKSHFVKLTITIGSKNQICTLLQFQLEARPADRNFPDCANAEREKGALYHSCNCSCESCRTFYFWRVFNSECYRSNTFYFFGNTTS